MANYGLYIVKSIICNFSNIVYTYHTVELILQEHYFEFSQNNIIFVKPGNRSEMLGTHIGFEINTVTCPL